MNGVHEDGLEGALSEVNQRLAAAERRQAQTIEAISLEIKRMSETVDKRLRSVESRNDDAAAAAVREELTRMSSTLEARFDEIERREAAGFDRMGIEVGRLSERLEERVGTVEHRSAQAIEHVGEQVARMAERFNQRHDQLTRDLGERMLDSEDRASSRVTDAISSIMHRLAEVEQHSAEAIAPVQKAVTGVAAKLEKFESARDGGDDVAAFEAMATPSRRNDDFPSFGGPAAPLAPEPHLSPLAGAQPTRAAPLPPRMPMAHDTSNDDVYFAEDDLVGEEAPAPPPMETQVFDVIDADDLLVEDSDVSEFTAPPPEDDDPFWSPETLETALPPQTAPTMHANMPALDDDISFDDDEPLFGDDPAEVAFAHAPPTPEAAQAVHEPSLMREEPLSLEHVSEPEATPSKNDYLAAARKAAQAQSMPSKGKDKQTKEPKASDVAVPEAPRLRGSSRVVLWGSAGMIALSLMGAAWYFGGRPQAPTATPAPEAPHPIAPATMDQAPTPQDPTADTTQTAADTTSATPLAATNASQAPAAPGAATTHATTPAMAQPVVAGPLPARSVSMEAAANNGDVVAQYQLGLQRLTGGRTQDGVMMLRRSADRGLAMAQYRMAKLYERGEGVPADLNVARQWTERAAAAGNRRAMHDLGVYFARGEGAPLDEGAAFRWFRQAAELGVADSQYNLGVLYQQGRGVGASPSEALFWFSVAARQGDHDAAAHATSLEAQLAPQQVQQAHARAEAFHPRAASAIANGDFGPRPWGSATVAQR